MAQAGDRQSFDLEGHQLALLDAVLTAADAHHTELVVVTICGRPVTFSSTDFPDNAILGRVPALLAAFRPGEEGGAAIADVILGEHNPGGRLAQNWLRNVGQVFSPANPWYQYKWGSWFENGDGTREFFFLPQNRPRGLLKLCEGGWLHDVWWPGC